MALTDNIESNLPCVNDENPYLVLQKLLSNSNFSLGTMYNMFKLVPKTVPGTLIWGSVGLIPVGNEEDTQEKLNLYMTILEAMTEEELACKKPNRMQEAHIVQIASRSGCRVEDVKDLLAQQKRFANWHNINRLERRPMNMSRSRIVHIRR